MKRIKNNQVQTENQTDHTKKTNTTKQTNIPKILTILMVLSLIIPTIALAIPTAKASTTPDYEYHFDLPSDGSNDSSEHYNIVRDDSSQKGSIDIKAYKDNATAIIDLENIKEITLYFNSTDINPEQFKTLLSITGGSFTIVLSSDVHEMDFTFTGIPEFLDAELNDENWQDYTYYSSNETIDFHLQMSTNTLEFFYEGVLGDLLAFVLTIVAIRFIFSTFRDLPTDRGGNF